MDLALYMDKAIELAQMGLGKVKSNPLVGAVVVYNNTIIGQGYHECFGGAHAEINAINSVADKSLLPYSTLFVTLEPCAHHGKTPPCASRIVQEKISQVVIGQLDPNPKVNGKGIAYLREHGVNVTSGIQEAACRWMNRRFNTFFEKERPYIILKWAQSADGFMDPSRVQGQKGSIAISSEESRAKVQQWRKEEMAILVGRNTIQMDNPRLTVHDDIIASPLRIVLDPQGQLQPYDQWHIGQCPPNTIVVHQDNHKILELPSGMTALPYHDDAFKDIFAYLRQHEVTSILVEGGALTLQYLIENNLWDEARVFVAPHYLHAGLTAPSMNQKPKTTEASGVDQLNFYYR